MVNLEQVIAQIRFQLDQFLADLAKDDLCLLKTTVTINITASSENELALKNIPSQSGRMWNLDLPKTRSDDRDEINRSRQNFFLATGTLLSDLSLASDASTNEILENCFRDGVMSKLFVAQPYELLYREFVTKDRFDATKRASLMKSQPPQPFQIREYSETRWFDGPGPGYSSEESERWLKNRYQFFMLPIRHTWPRLKKEMDFLAIVARLRADGWLDWHILSAVQGITLNYRTMQHPEARRSFEFMTGRFNQLTWQTEQPVDDPVPLGLFSEERMRSQLDINMLSFLKVVGLACRQRVPDYASISHFLGHRYEYWTDDIDHLDLFA